MIDFSKILQAQKSKNQELYDELWTNATAYTEERVKHFLKEGMTLQQIAANNTASLFDTLQKAKDEVAKAKVGIAQKLLDELIQRHNISLITKPADIRVGDIIYWKWKASKGKDKGKVYYNDIQVMDILGNNKFSVRYTHHPVEPDHSFQLSLTDKNIICGYRSKIIRKPHLFFFFFFNN